MTFSEVHQIIAQRTPAEIDAILARHRSVFAAQREAKATETTISIYQVACPACGLTQYAYCGALADFLPCKRCGFEEWVMYSEDDVNWREIEVDLPITKVLAIAGINQKG